MVQKSVTSEESQNFTVEKNDIRVCELYVNKAFIYFFKETSYRKPSLGQ